VKIKAPQQEDYSWNYPLGRLLRGDEGDRIWTYDWRLSLFNRPMAALSNGASPFKFPLTRRVMKKQKKTPHKAGQVC